MRSHAPAEPGAFIGCCTRRWSASGGVNRPLRGGLNSSLPCGTGWVIQYAISLAFGSWSLSKIRPPPCSTLQQQRLGEQAALRRRADAPTSPAPSRSSCTCRWRGSTSGVFAGSARSTACAAGTTRKRAAGAVDVVVAARAGAGVGRQRAAAVDLQLRQEDRVDALLEVGEGQLLARHLQRVLDVGRVVEGVRRRRRRPPGRRRPVRQRPRAGAATDRSSWCRTSGARSSSRWRCSWRCPPAAPPWSGRRAGRVRHGRRPAQQVVAGGRCRCRRSSTASRCSRPRRCR